MEKERNDSGSKATTLSAKYGAGSVMAWAYIPAHGSLVCIDHMTAGRSNRMNSEVYRALLSAQIQPNVAQLMGRCLTVPMDIDAKHTVQAAQELLKEKKQDILK